MALIFNNGVTDITPSTASGISVTIDGTTYAEAYDSSVATTIDNFVASYAETLADKFGIAVIDSTTTVDLYNVDGHTVTVNQGTAATAYEKLAIDQAGVFTQTAEKTIVYATSNTNTSYDVITLTFPTANQLNKAWNKLVRNSFGGDVVSNIPCKAAAG